MIYGCMLYEMSWLRGLPVRELGVHWKHGWGRNVIGHDVGPNKRGVSRIWLE